MTKTILTSAALTALAVCTMTGCKKKESVEPVKTSVTAEKIRSASETVSVDTASVTAEIGNILCAIQRYSSDDLKPFFALPHTIDTSDEFWYCTYGQDDSYLGDTSSLTVENFEKACDTLLFNYERVSLAAQISKEEKLDSVVAVQEMELDSQKCSLKVSYNSTDQLVDFTYLYSGNSGEDDWTSGFTLQFRIIDGKKLRYFKTLNIG